MGARTIYLAKQIIWALKTLYQICIKVYLENARGEVHLTDEEHTP